MCALVVWLCAVKRVAAQGGPEWNLAGPQFDIGYQLATYTLWGMALGLFTPGGTAPSEEFLCYLEKQLADLAREGRAAQADGMHAAHAASN